MTDFIIPQSKTEEPEYLGKGIYLVKIVDIVPNLTKEGTPNVSPKGYHSLKIILEDQKSKSKFTDIMYYGDEKVQWALDGLMAAIGVNNKDGGVSKNEAIGKEVFVVLWQTNYVDTEGNPIMKDNGKPKSYVNRKRYYKVVDRTAFPVDNQLENNKIENRPQAAPPPVPEVGNSSPF